jgi:dGTPase
MTLAAYGCDPGASRGRRFAQDPTPTRSEYQRDRDRIVHSTAFRRLVYKTQVFLNHEGDLFRSRLTHSLEVAQLGRSIARNLNLNEDLVEAIALAHDLGHTPFGHAGQDALNECLKKHNPESSGFEHNLQSLRVVDSLEERYPTYNGLNLTFETREGILKHCSRRNARRIEAREPGGVAQRHVEQQAGAQQWLEPGLEGQLANLADEIAYNAHDIDDGVRSGLLTIDQLQEVPLLNLYTRKALAQHPGLMGRRLLFEVIRLMLSAQVDDVTEATRMNLLRVQPPSVDAVRQQPALVRFTPDMAAQSAVLKQFLSRNLYRHPQVVNKMQRAQLMVQHLFEAYLAAPSCMPQAPISPTVGTDGQDTQQARPERLVADYIAGMTDRFASKEHERLGLSCKILP